MAAEAGEGLSVGPEVTGLTLAFDGHGEEEREGIFAGAGGTGQNDGMGKVAGGDGSAEGLNDVRVPDEFVEIGGEWREGVHRRSVG